MDQCAEVPPAEVVSVTENDWRQILSFECFHGHAIMHNIPHAAISPAGRRDIADENYMYVAGSTLDYKQKTAVTN